LAGWLEQAAAPVNRLLETVEIPIRVPADRILFALYPCPAGAGGVSGEAAPADPVPGRGPGEQAAGLYEITLKVLTPSASQAGALTAMVSVIRSFLSQASGDEGLEALLMILLANPPVQDDSALILRSGRVEDRDIALLFNLFSVYSKLY
jgi:hypothetical protein